MFAAGIVALFAACASLVRAADKTASEYHVTSLPGAPAPLLNMYAGHVEVNHSTNGNLFFWHFAQRNNTQKQRTIIWLNGGPGCSSEDGALMEVGPYRVGSDGQLVYNEGSWDEFANLLFVDNPVGTGYSYVNTNAYLHELGEMADQFIVFLEKWFKIFPEFVDNEIFIAGESYAGQHIPYIARAIVERNARVNQGDKWNLQGLLIGNGWIEPVEQYISWQTFAYAEGLIQGGTDEANRVEKSMSACLTELSKPGADNKVYIGVCENVLNEILEVSKKDNQCYNMYDVRLRDTWPACGMNWPPDLVRVTPYLRRQDVVDALHINADKRTGWTECSGAVSSNFRASKSDTSAHLLPGLLEGGLPILLFSGAKDLICNHRGTEGFLEKMTWNNSTGLGSAPKQTWTFEGEHAGYYQEARGLTYVLIDNSSHMVPFDYPERSRDMLNRFMNVPFVGQLDGTGSSSNTDEDKPTETPPSHDDEDDQEKQARSKAFYRSGEAVLFVLVCMVGFFGWWMWKERRRARLLKERDLGSYAPVKRDVEAQDFDERELDNLDHHDHGADRNRPFRDDNTSQERVHYDIGSDSEGELEAEESSRHANTRR